MKGKKTGGRKPGSRNKNKKAIRDLIVQEAKLTPLAYMIKVMLDPKTAKERKDDMAKAAAPYVHPRLQAIQQLNINAPVDMKTVNNMDLARRIAFTLQDARRQKQLPNPEAPK